IAREWWIIGCLNTRFSIRRYVLLFALACAAPASAQKVLLIADDDANGSAALGAALTAAGMTVTQTQAPSWQYNGGNPAPQGQDVIVLLAGTSSSRTNDMPGGGQN